MPDAKDYIGKRGEAIIEEKLLDFCGRPLPFFDPHPLGEKCPIFDFLVELVTKDKTPPYFLVSAKSTQKGKTKKSLALKVGVKAKDVLAMVRCPVPAYLIGVDEPDNAAYIVSMHGKVKGPISSIPTTHKLDAATLTDLWTEVHKYWKTLNHKLKDSKFEMWVRVMTEKEAERAKFTERRARALATVLLSGREDLLVQELTDVDIGINYRIILRTEKPGLREFGIELRAAYSPVTADTANKVLKPTMVGMSRYGPFPFPVVLFYFTMMESQSWYTWVMQPIELEGEQMELELRQEADCRPLDDASLNTIIACVDQWYDFAFEGKGKGKKAGTTSKKGTKPVKSEVVITELDSVLFDYSEHLLQTREQLTAAKQCSAYIIKTYPTPLRTLTGFWDRVEDEKGRAVITLTIKDAITKKTATARFTPKDIQSPAFVYQRFNELRGDILHPG